MPRLKSAIRHPSGELVHYFLCPGCKTNHLFEGKWAFNGNMEKPTFTPSHVNLIDADRQCHIFITDGVVHYLSDCTHELAGQSIPLADMDAMDAMEDASSVKVEAAG